MGKRHGILILVLVLVGIGVRVGSFSDSSEPGIPSEEGPGVLPEGTGRIRVEVLNRSGVSGVAREATASLRDQGFDVVYYGNAGTYGQDPSVVIDRVGNVHSAELISAALGIPGVRSEPDPTLLVDVTVLLGPEWTAPIGKEKDLEGSAPWWDLRRFLRRDGPGG